MPVSDTALAKTAALVAGWKKVDAGGGMTAKYAPKVTVKRWQKNKLLLDVKCKVVTWAGKRVVIISVSDDRVLQWHLGPQ